MGSKGGGRQRKQNKREEHRNGKQRVDLCLCRGWKSCATVLRRYLQRSNAPRDKNHSDSDSPLDCANGGGEAMRPQPQRLPPLSQHRGGGKITRKRWTSTGRKVTGIQQHTHIHTQTRKKGRSHNKRGLHSAERREEAEEEESVYVRMFMYACVSRRWHVYRRCLIDRGEKERETECAHARLYIYIYSC